MLRMQQGSGIRHCVFAKVPRYGAPESGHSSKARFAWKFLVAASSGLFVA